MRPCALAGPYLAFVAAVSVLSSPGHLWFPDDEIVFQTTESLVERGTFAIEGIPKRTGEPKGRPDGTFGWAQGTDGRRYGFFGHGLSFVAMPFYVAGRLAADHLGPAASHLPRSDHYVYHRRSHRADLTRLFVSLTNAFVTALVGWTSAAFFAACNVRWPAAVVASLLVVFGTVLWAYAGTFLSEPLSALALVAAAWATTRIHALAPGRRRTLWALAAGAIAGASVHVHVLNVIAVPCFLGYFWWGGSQRPDRASAIASHLAGGLMLLLLGLDHAARFGDPFETGRYDHYSHFVWPWLALVAFLVAPGRSFFLYAPAVTVGLAGLRRTLERARAPLAFVTAVFATRLLFAASRSDWWGGWSFGPRYLVPTIPLCALPLAHLLDGWRDLRRGHRRTIAGALAVCVLLAAILAVFSPFEHMHAILVRDGPGPPTYLERSHWELRAAPFVNVWTLPSPDILPVGALRLWRVGHRGPGYVLLAVLGFGAAAFAILVARLRRLASATAPEHPARHGADR
ncbi:MAG: hypothetical protein D6705_01880 [Deltaproteobacteria bacterium]|nr:MAG: hypothetical protein D6705_01880 [Deltaproteobacteria bacterium]